MKKRWMALAAAAVAGTGIMGMTMSGCAEETFTYWSCYSGDSAKWEQWRVDLYNETYADEGYYCDLQFVPDGAGISNGKLLSAIASGTAPDLIVCDDASNAYSYAANGSFVALNDYLEGSGIDLDGFFSGCAECDLLS